MPAYGQRDALSIDLPVTPALPHDCRHRQRQTTRVRLRHRKIHGHPVADIIPTEASLGTPPNSATSGTVVSTAQDFADHRDYHARPGRRPVHALANRPHARLRHPRRGFRGQRHRARFQCPSERAEYPRPDHQ